MGGLAAALVSAVIAVPVLRLRGIYASLLTFSFGEVVRLLVISDESGVTGGSFGLSGIPGLAFEGLSPDAKERGSLLARARDRHADGGLHLGLHPFPAGSRAEGAAQRTRLRGLARGEPDEDAGDTFATSAFIAGIAGSFYAQYFGTISPSVMGLGPLSLFVAMLVVGGLGTVLGPDARHVIVVVSEYLRDFDEARLIIVGLILLVTIVLAPRGLVPLLQQGWNRLKRWMAEDDLTPEPSSPG